jgi:Heterokaryon incompatibility protein (HET)
MRLINLESMRLQELDGAPMPKYAILSHTWGEEEVTFQDIHQSHASSMAGYVKIKYLCDQAREDGLKFAWIDTCCIDKSSSAELSEAINSMFQWYQAARVCYAYLVDVTLDAFESDIRKSRWFRRGWTLQELLAPERVEFYGTNWVYLGGKQGLIGLISETTGIPELALRRPSTIPIFSIAARMFWACQRETRRVEDTAYCLLGIFGVNMPLIYGEGIKAFKRLQEELIKASDDESLFAWNTSLSSGDLLAHSPLAFRQGREIVPIRATVATKPYSMTNKGLHIHLPLLEVGPDSDGEKMFLGILNCQIRNDYSGYIAIPLNTTKTPDTFTRGLNFRLGRVSEEEAANAKSHTIYIRQRECRSFTSTCWLRSDTVRHRGYLLKPNFYHFFNSWDAETQMSRVDHDWFHHVRCFTFVQPKLNIAFSVVLVNDAIEEKAGVILHLKPQTQDVNEWQAKLSRHTLQNFAEEWQGNWCATSASLLLEEPSTRYRRDTYEVNVKVSQQGKLKQDIWVLDVSMACLERL